MLGVQLRVLYDERNRLVVVAWGDVDEVGDAGSFYLDLMNVSPGERHPEVVPFEPRRIIIRSRGTYILVAELWAVVDGKAKVRGRDERRVEVR